MNAGAIPSDRPGNEGIISQVLDAQAENIADTQNLVEKLYDRLQPVLAPSTPSNGRETDPSRKEIADPSVSVRSRIKANTRRIETMNLMLREISDRLEV